MLVGNNNLSSTSKVEAPTLALAQLVAAYLPESGVADLIDFVSSPKINRSFRAAPRHFEAVTMMVDITGFTPLCEALAKMGHEGAEQVTALINSFFNQALSIVKQQGGVIAKFGGDAFTAFFQMQPTESWASTAERALYSAFALQKMVLDYEGLRLPGTPGEEAQIFRLYAKVGLGAGSILSFGIGTPETYCDFQIVGAPFNQAAEAEHQANRGEVVAHKALLEKIEKLQPYLEAGETRDTCVYLRDFHATAPLTAFPHFNLSGLSSEILESFIAQAAPFVPGAVYDRLKLGYQSLPGEHRRVVSLFVNFTGFRWMEDSLAPAHFDEYYTTVLAEIQRYGGHLSRISSGDKGDLLHIMFGAPRSHQDDEEQAVRCALALQQIARRFSFIRTQKIGVSSGFVFAGEIGSPDRHEYTIMGDTVNLSARLMQMASDWSVLLDQATAARLQNYFEFAPPRPVQLKGKQGFIEVCEVWQVRQTSPTLTASASGPIYGRNIELELAGLASQEALAGDSRIIAVSGEPGIGKSFFLAKIVERWQLLGGRAVLINIVNHERGAFKLWANWLAEIFQLDSRTGIELRQQQFAQAIESLAPELAEWIPLWGELLDFSMPESPLLRSLDRPARRQRLAEYTPQLIAALARRQPLLLLCDDFQWADSASLELLDQIEPMLKELPLLLCVGYRSQDEPKAALLKAEECLALPLEALSLDASQEFILASLSNEAVNEADGKRFVAQVNEMTGGNPFFIEELLSTLRAEALLEAAIQGAGSSAPLSYNLQSLIMARLDALESGLREVVLAAAVVGSDFSDEVIKPLLPRVVAESLGDEAFSPLHQLADLDLLQPQTELNSRNYRFRHALIQQVAYDSLPFARRRILHEEVAAYFENGTPAMGAESGLERLAYHYERSNNDVKAVFYLARSAARSSRLFANLEARQQYQTALARATRAGVPTDPGLPELLVGLGDVQAQMADFPAALESYNQALDKTPESMERVQLEQRQAEVLVRATRFDEALETIAQAEMELEQLRAEASSRTVLNAVKIAWARLAELYSTILIRQSKYEAARILARDGLGLLNGPVGRQAEGLLIKIKLYQALSAAEAVLKQFEPARQALRKALRLSAKRDDPLIQGQLQLRLAILTMQSTQYKKAKVLFERALPMVERTGAKDHLAYVLLPGGENLLSIGELQQAQAWGERGLKLSEEVGTPFLICSAHYLLARVGKERGEWGKSREHFRLSTTIAEEHSLWGRLSDYLCRQGELHSLRGEHDLAQQLLQQSLDCIDTHNLPLGARYFYSLPILAQIYCNQQLFERAAVCLKEARQNLSEKRTLNETYFGIHVAECYALSSLNGQVRAELGPPEEIRQNLLEALHLVQSLSMKLNLPEIYRITGLVEWAQGRPAEAMQYFNRGLAQARKAAQPLEVARLLVCRSQLKLSLLSPVSSRAKVSKRSILQDKKEAATLFAHLGIEVELNRVR